MTVASKPDGRVARREGTRELIMAAATDLFAARGVTSTSIDDIAEAAGIAKGSIYYNFESKAGLVEAILARSSELLTEALAKAGDGRQAANCGQRWSPSCWSCCVPIPVAPASW